MRDISYAQSERTALAVQNLFAQADRQVPTGLDLQALIDGEGHTDKELALFGHILAGSSSPSDPAHEVFAKRIAEIIGAPATLATIIRACYHTTFRSPGNLGRELLVLGYAGDACDVVAGIPDNCPHDIAEEIVTTFSSYMLAAGDVCSLARRLKTDSFWLLAVVAKSAQSPAISAEVVSAILELGGDTDMLLRSHRAFGRWFDLGVARTLLASGDVRQAALAVNGASDWLSAADLDVLLEAARTNEEFLPVLVVGAWSQYQDRFMRTGAQFDKVARVLLDRDNYAPLAKLPAAFVSDLVTAGDPELVARLWETADAKVLAGFLATSHLLVTAYVKAPNPRLAVIGELAASGAVSAESLMISHRCLVENNGLRDAVLGMVPGVVPAFVAMVTGTSKSMGSPGFFVVLDEVFAEAGVILAEAGVPDGAARLWQATIEQRAKSPASDPTLSVKAMVSRYSNRWIQAAKRTAKV